MRRISVVIVAAGEGKRFGSAKQFALLRGKPVLDWSLEKFEYHEKVSEIILVLKDEALKKNYLQRYRKIVAVTGGGEKRRDSVLSGLLEIDQEKADIVLIHDGVRPLVDRDLIDRVIDATLRNGAAIPAVPVEDTIKIIEREGVIRTLEREKLFRIQTPQGFLYDTIKAAVDKAREENFYGTDDASLVERLGERIFMVEGDPKNIKITTSEDLRVAEALLED